MMLIALIVLIASYIIIQLWQTATLYAYIDKPLGPLNDWPVITVLVAARNEEKSLKNCLQSLSLLDYPKDKILIIVGNDQSTDDTEKIIDSFVAQEPNFIKVNIQDDNTGLKAKARVMAQMDSHAKGEFYLVTDADVQVKPEWAKMLVRHMKADVGVASGTTMVNSGNVWSNVQRIDWAYFMGLLNVISYSGVPATAVGNNMIVRSSAYWQTGGYAAIKFSITEDYKLYSEICKCGWKWENIMTPEVLAYSQPVEEWKTLLHQRKRWLSGGKELPWYWWILFGVFGLFYFISIVGFYFFPLVTGLLWLVKFLIQVIQINKIYSLVGEKKPDLAQHITYELYLFITTIATSLFFASPFRTVWKGRKY